MVVSGHKKFELKHVNKQIKKQMSRLTFLFHHLGTFPRICDFSFTVKRGAINSYDTHNTNYSAFCHLLNETHHNTKHTVP